MELSSTKLKKLIVFVKKKFILGGNFKAWETDQHRSWMFNKKNDRRKNNTKYSSTSKIVKYISLGFSVSTISSFKSIEITIEVKVSWKTLWILKRERNGDK